MSTKSSWPSQVAPHLAKDACVVSCTSGAMDDGQQKDLILVADFGWFWLILVDFVGVVSFPGASMGFWMGGVWKPSTACSYKSERRCPCCHQATIPLLEGEVWRRSPSNICYTQVTLRRRVIEWVIFWEQDTLQHARTCPRHKVISFPTLSILSCVDVFSKRTDLSPQSAVTRHWLGTWPCSEVHFLDCPVSGGPRGAAAGGFHGPMYMCQKDWLYTNIGGWSSIHYGFIYSL